MKTGSGPVHRFMFFITVLFLLLGYSVVAAQEKGRPGVQKIVTKKCDITGDGKLDAVSVKGVSYGPKGTFLKEIKFVVAPAKGKSTVVSLKAGYEPKLQFADFNRDGVDDVFITVPTRSNGGFINNYAYTFIEGKAHDLTVPPPVSVNGQYLDNYKAVISVPLQKSITFDMSGRKNDYGRVGLYQSNGKLNEPAEIMVDRYSVLKIIEEGKGLKGIQRVSGANDADALADIYSKWEYRDGNWKLVRTKTKTYNGSTKRL